VRVESFRSLPIPGSASDSISGFGAEADLVERLRRGDEDACEELVRGQTARLLAVARRYLRSEEDARDAVQEGFVAAFRSIGRFQGGSSVSTWLHRIVINACLMKLRTSRRRPESSIEELLPQFDETGHRVVEPEEWRESAEERIDRGETRRIVREAIGRLPEHYRTVLLLRDIEELSTAEAAAVLQLTENAVKIRLHRARQALRALLAPTLGSALKV
jgi:RNA polymerase sigma-70 factor, ECF subfamily